VRPPDKFKGHVTCPSLEGADEEWLDQAAHLPGTIPRRVLVFQTNFVVGRWSLVVGRCILREGHSIDLCTLTGKRSNRAACTAENEAA
jgi:hypothetical protein